MKQVIAWLKRIQLARVLTVFMASLMLVFGTACNSKVLAKTADQIRPEVPEKAVTNTYQGGMNDYKDVDPRRDTSAAEAKAKGLVDNARRNLSKRADDPDQYSENYRSGTPLGERIQNLGEDVAESAGEIGKGVSKGTQKGLENIKENAQNAPRYVKKTGQKTADADTVQD